MDEEPLEFDYSTNPTAHLRPVMGDDSEPGGIVEHDDGVHLVRVDSNRNLWELVVDGDGIVTFAPELIGTSEALAKWVDRRAARARSDDEEQSEPGDDKRWSGGFQ